MRKTPFSAVLAGFFLFVVPSLANAATAATTVLPAVAYVSPSGSDAGSCSLAQPCATFTAAYRAVADGGTVYVGAGTYVASDPGAAATRIDPDPSKSGTVTFVCQGGTVDFSAPNFTFFPGTSGVRMQGSCFRFHVVHFGYGGYAQQTRSITLDGVHMDSFEISGAAGITIQNSEVGPMVACYQPGTTGNGGNGGAIPASAWCNPNDPVESYWATLANGSANQQYEPFIHNDRAGDATNISLIGNHIHDLQTKDSFNLHQGGLLLWNVNGLLLRGNTFDHNAVYDILENSNSVDANWTFENNVFAWPLYPLEAGQPVPGGETVKDYREVVLGGSGVSLTNLLIRYNSLGHGLLLTDGGSYSGARVIGNSLGEYSYCPSGPDYHYNAVVDGQGSSPCGTNTRFLTGFPYMSYASLAWQPQSGSGLIGLVPNNGPDYAIATDLSGATRPAPSTAGAYEGSGPPTDILPPSAPLGVGIGTSTTPTTVLLQWTQSTDNVGVAGYTVYLDGASVGTTASTSFTVANLACGSTHSFAVDAYDAAGNRSQKTSITGSTATCTPPPPSALAAPANMTVAAATATSVTVSWSAVPGAAGYHIYKDGSLLHTIPAAYFSGQVTAGGLSCPGSYTFNIAAYDTSGTDGTPATLTTTCH